jgi:DNA-binding CsgD family transcriptional regulator/PAS domain-containing protein
MSVDQDILSLIDEIYEAAGDEGAWIGVMQNLLDITGGSAVTFCVIDGAEQPQLPVFLNLNFEQAFIEDYLANMVPHDPTVQYIVAHPEQKIVHDAQFISEREKDKHFYYDWHASYSDTRHRLAGMTSPMEKVQSGITLHRTRGQGDFESEHIERFAFLFRHIERAVHFGFRLGTLRTMQQISAGLIDANPQAIFLLDNKGRIVLANRAAEGLIVSNDGIVASADGIALRNLAENQTLQELIGRALARQAQTGAFPAGAMRALRPSGKRPYSVMISPLTGRSRALLTTAQPAVCVIIIDPELQPPFPARSLKALYGLTPAESRLAQRLAAGEELKVAAAQLCIGYGTARAQLAAVFRKTETNRQGELVRLLSTLPPPLS